MPGYTLSQLHVPAMAKQIEAATQAGKYTGEIKSLSTVILIEQLLIKGSHGIHVEEHIHHIRHMNI